MITILELSMRREKIGAIIRKERKKKFKSQAAFADSIREKLNLQPEAITQGTVSNWENGNSLPSLDYLLAMSRIFNCDCGYLLGDYDEHTRDSMDICKATGLSEESVNTLCNLKSWGVEAELTSVIDGLISDLNHGEKGASLAPLVYLIHWFLTYKGSGKIDKMVHTNGEIVDCHDLDGYIPNSVKLNDRIIENAALMEIQQGLISLKKRFLRKERGKSGKH